MVHADYDEVCSEVDRALQVEAHQEIDAGAPRRNICNQARKAHETRLTQEHEAIMPAATPHEATPSAPEEEHPDVG